MLEASLSEVLIYLGLWLPWPFRCDGHNVQKRLLLSTVQHSLGLLTAAGVCAGVFACCPRLASAECSQQMQTSCRVTALGLNLLEGSAIVT